MQHDFPPLQGLEFADEFDGLNESIDVLVGADQYFKIVQREIIEGPDESGPVPCVES